MCADMVERPEFGRETVISLDKDTVGVGADDGIVARSVLDDGKVTFGISDEEIFRHSARNPGEDIEGLAGGCTMFSDVAEEVGGREAVVPFVDVGVS